LIYCFSGADRTFILSLRVATWDPRLWSRGWGGRPKVIWTKWNQIRKINSNSVIVKSKCGYGWRHFNVSDIIFTYISPTTLILKEDCVLPTFVRLCCSPAFPDPIPHILTSTHCVFFDLAHVCSISFDLTQPFVTYIGLHIQSPHSLTHPIWSLLSWIAPHLHPIYITFQCTLPIGTDYTRTSHFEIITQIFGGL